MARARTMLSLAIAVTPLALTIASCQDPTEVTVVITTASPCGSSSDQIGATALYVASDPTTAESRIQTQSPQAQTSHCLGGDIGSLVVTPGQTEGAIVIITGTGGKSPTDCIPGSYQNCIIARRSFNFVKHTPLRIPVEMDVDCADQPCDSTSTCVHGKCYQAAVDCAASGTCSDPTTNPGVDAGLGVLPDGAPNPGMDAGNTQSDGNSGGDGSNPTDGAILDGGDADVGPAPQLDSGHSIDAGPLMCVLGMDGATVVGNCGGQNCQVNEGCCIPAGGIQLTCTPTKLCVGETFCCMSSQCANGCCGGPAVATPAPRVDLMICAGGSGAKIGDPPAECQ